MEVKPMFIDARENVYPQRQKKQVCQKEKIPPYPQIYARDKA